MRRAVQNSSIRAGAVIVLLAGWEWLSHAGLVDPFYLPPPSKIGDALVHLFADPAIWSHMEATFGAALMGLAIGALGGSLLAVLAAVLPLLNLLLQPVMSALNAVPRIVLAPLLVIWFGIGIASKVALSVLLVAVLMFFAVFTAIAQVDRRLIERVQT